MRELKFKVWDKDYKEFVRLDEDAFISIDGEKVQVITGNENYGDEYENVEILQYTGLKDKNDKEIYEGDILEFDSHRGIINCTVSYNRASFKLNPINGHIVFSDLDAYKMDYMKIIGNIYENQELLQCKDSV